MEDTSAILSGGSVSSITVPWKQLDPMILSKPDVAKRTHFETADSTQVVRHCLFNIS